MTKAGRKKGGQLTAYTGTRLFDIARGLGISDTELARRMGFSRTTLWHIKVGRYGITTAFVEAACRVTSLPETMLFFVDPIVTQVSMSDTTVTEPAAELAGVAD